MEVPEGTLQVSKDIEPRAVHPQPKVEPTEPMPARSDDQLEKSTKLPSDQSQVQPQLPELAQLESAQQRGERCSGAAVAASAPLVPQSLGSGDKGQAGQSHQVMHQSQSTHIMPEPSQSSSVHPAQVKSEQTQV